MGNFDDDVLKAGFDINKYIEESAKKNKEKYPYEFYKKAMKLISEDLMEEFMKLVEEFNYKPF